MIWLNEAVTVLKIVSVSLVLVGVIGLQLSGGAH
jgi:quaternary ammonium compound-resistance protein SugE